VLNNAKVNESLCYQEKVAKWR